jgi:hypothetical protein
MDASAIWVTVSGKRDAPGTFFHLFLASFSMHALRSRNLTKYMFAYWCLNDLLMDWIVNEGVESVEGRTAVGKRVIAVGGMALANNQTMAATDNTRTNTGSISEEDTGDSSLPKRHANRDLKRRVQRELCGPSSPWP